MGRFSSVVMRPRPLGRVSGRMTRGNTPGAYGVHGCGGGGGGGASREWFNYGGRGADSGVMVYLPASIGIVPNTPIGGAPAASWSVSHGSPGQTLTISDSRGNVLATVPGGTGGASQSEESSQSPVEFFEDINTAAFGGRGWGTYKNTFGNTNRYTGQGGGSDQGGFAGGLLPTIFRVG